MTARMYRMTEIHQRIDERLRDEQKRKRPDDLEISRLKKLKLRAKDILHRLTHRGR
ncbi:DUF465 domain-containing protein [Sphingomicrobium sediminis]|uniref:DUF465 domain-containing protein n=1 Tax=Sphingomicrobium sediminis TaxID=2950949 RepID=A0A9X2EHR1_9SPHN|nr:DUF465 domain-containing protein [Sphingomicrobium sediminis]MCM8557765.1 DUF465 domain-containing protein [Sphingomicrobium sediminis]